MMWDEDPEKNYRPLQIGCFAKKQTELLCFFNSFLENNQEIIKEVRCNVGSDNKIVLKDNTCLEFRTINMNNMGYRFDQLLIYNMLATDLPNDVINGDLINYYLPEEFHKYQIMYYEDN